MVVATVSHSEVESWLLCERRHYYGYGLELQRRRESDSLTRGILGHAMMEHYLSQFIVGAPAVADTTALSTLDLSPVVASSPQAISTASWLIEQMTPENVTLIKELAELFAAFLEVDPLKDFEILAVEKEFVIELTDEVSMGFVVDFIARDPQGKIVVGDNKFVYDFLLDDNIDILPQIPKYMAALRAMNLPVDYAMYLMFRYRNKKNAVPSDKVRMREFEVSDARIIRTITEQVETAEEILERKRLPLEVQSHKAKRVANNMVCRSCSFKRLCIAELHGHNAQLIADTEYMKRERKTFDTEIEAE